MGPQKTKAGQRTTAGRTKREDSVNDNLRKGKSRDKTTPRQIDNHPKTPRQRLLAISGLPSCPNGVGGGAPGDDLDVALAPLALGLGQLLHEAVQLLLQRGVQLFPRMDEAPSKWILYGIRMCLIDNL